MPDTPSPGADLGSPVPAMLDDPGLSRQWVLRRLQKSLSADLSTRALLDGLAAGARSADAPLVTDLAAHTATRVRALLAAIEREGGVPYSSVGLARAVSRVAGRLAAPFGPRLWRTPLARLQEHRLGELDALVAFARGAAGVDPRLADRLAPLVEQAEADLRRLRARAPEHVVS